MISLMGEVVVLDLDGRIEIGDFGWEIEAVTVGA
jgi:hypothetical protein